MKNYICSILGFIAGVTAGVFVGKSLYKKKYEIIAQNEIDSVKEAFRFHEEKAPKEPPKEEKLREKPSLSEMKEYVRTIEENGYALKGEKGDSGSPAEHEIIAPEDYEVDDEYDKDDLTLYADDILVDVSNNRLSEKEIVKMIGKDWKRHFGEYEDEAVYVRNNNTKIKYEIVKDDRNYTDTLTTE